MGTAYSCYVDTHPRFEWQATLLCASLIENCKVSPRDIRFHANPSGSEAFRRTIQNFGATCISASPFNGSNAYCNKIVQTRSGAFAEYEQVVLLDCDIYMMSSLSIELCGAAAMGRPVDCPNPPLEILGSLYGAAGLNAPALVPVGAPETPNESTFATNWNGGFYVLGGKHLDELGTSWERWARVLIAQPAEILGRYRVHIDQLSLGMALDELKLPWKHLSERHNVPTHLPWSKLAHPPEVPLSLHYHDTLDHLGRIRRTGAQSTDTAIDLANEQIRDLVRMRFPSDPDFTCLFQAWQATCNEPTESAVAQAREAFRAPRYLRHNARRQEHLAAMGLELSNKTVLEFGAGIGDHSSFFLDRGCSVLSVEPREENVAFISRRHGDPNEHLPKADHKIMRASAEEAVELLRDRRFQIVYNYGLLYHMAHPLAFLEASARLCAGVYLLETAVSDLSSSSAHFEEDARNPTNAIGGDCELVTRQVLFDTLRAVFPFVYTPVQQPAHEQFLMDWSRPPACSPNRHRAVFVGSVLPLSQATLSPELLVQHAV